AAVPAHPERWRAEFCGLQRHEEIHAGSPAQLLTSPSAQRAATPSRQCLRWKKTACIGVRGVILLVCISSSLPAASSLLFCAFSLGTVAPRLLSVRLRVQTTLCGLRHLAWRTISTASRRQFENKVPEKQKLFQEDNGIPVHLKGGIADALLYRATMILTVGGTAYAIYQLAVASFPKKQD
uniref:Cytochrome c oxidase subunit 7A2, mitochondrial n=1 Tax=Equus asinus TaxID=9793 RepID=A0A9L0J7X5_EQUAS